MLDGDEMGKIIINIMTVACVLSSFSMTFFLIFIAQ